jgi:UDPglucose 6-dehydrogenase
MYVIEDDHTADDDLTEQVVMERRIVLGTDAVHASVLIVGSGVVGTATGSGLAVNGASVAFYDTSEERSALLEANGLNVWSAVDLMTKAADVYLICVPVPTREDRVELDYIRTAATMIGRAISSRDDWCCVVVRSTVPPGTTDDVVLPLLERHSGRQAGVDFGLAVNPEFLRAVSAVEDFLSPRVIVIGAIDQRSEAAVRALYAPWNEVPLRSMTMRSAEATKYAANLFNATKISFFNEMHRVLLLAGAEPDAAFVAAAEGAEGLWNPRYGIRGGRPFGGACLPRDVAAFVRFAEDLGEETPLLRAAIAVNQKMVELDAAEPAEGRLPL